MTDSEAKTFDPIAASATRFRFGAVVLAAGASVRLGSPKQLLEIDGKPLLARTVESILQSPAWPVVVVLGAHAERIRPALARFPIIVIDNPAWPEGMAASLRAGITGLQQFSRRLDAGLIAVCDQPAFSAETVSRLITAYSTAGRSIAAAVYGGHRGVPALFGRAHFSQLMALTGEQGARTLLEGKEVTTVDMPELAIDIDTTADLNAYQSRATSPP